MLGRRPAGLYFPIRTLARAVPAVWAGKNCSTMAMTRLLFLAHEMSRGPALYRTRITGPVRKWERERGGGRDVTREGKRGKERWNERGKEGEAEMEQRGGGERWNKRERGREGEMERERERGRDGGRMVGGKRERLKDRE